MIKAFSALMAPLTVEGRSTAGPGNITAYTGEDAVIASVLCLITGMRALCLKILRA